MFVSSIIWYYSVTYCNYVSYRTVVFQLRTNQVTSEYQKCEGCRYREAEQLYLYAILYWTSSSGYNDENDSLTYDDRGRESWVRFGILYLMLYIIRYIQAHIIKIVIIRTRWRNDDNIIIGRPDSVNGFIWIIYQWYVREFLC